MFYKLCYRDIPFAYIILIICLFSFNIISFQAVTCPLNNTIVENDLCTDDTHFLSCRIHEELDKWRNITVAKNNTESCIELIKKGFCNVHPTEMSRYCCSASQLYCTSSEMIPTENINLTSPLSNTLSQSIISTYTPLSFSTAYVPKILVNTTAFPFNHLSLLTGSAELILSTQHNNTILSTTGNNIPILETDSVPIDKFCSFLEHLTNLAIHVAIQLQSLLYNHRRKLLVTKSSMVYDINPNNSVDINFFETNQIINYPTLISTRSDKNLRQRRRRRLGILESSHNNTATPVLPKWIDYHMIELFATMLLEPVVLTHMIDIPLLESNISQFGTELSTRLSNCQDCLLPMIEIILNATSNSIFPELLDNDRHKGLTPKDISHQLIYFIQRLSEEFKLIINQRDTDATAPTFTTFIQDLLFILHRLLQDGGLEHIMDTPHSFIDIIKSTFNSEIMIQHLFSEWITILHDHLHCPLPLDSLTPTELAETEFSTLSPDLSLTSIQQHTTTESTLRAINDSQHTERVLQEFTSRNNSMMPTINMKNLNFVADVPNPDKTIGDITQGHPHIVCLDQFSEFLQSIEDQFIHLNCSSLIAFIGCVPNHPLLTLHDIFYACRFTWHNLCYERHLIHPDLLSTEDLNEYNKTAVSCQEQSIEQNGDSVPTLTSFSTIIQLHYTYFSLICLYFLFK